MRNLTLLCSLVSVLVVTMSSCDQPAAEQPAWESEWLGQTPQEVIDIAEEQFQGFSRTMKENAYRYQELYWAGQDQNWEYAEYQREHIVEALEQGFVRRPEHEASAQQFMEVALPGIGEVIKTADQQQFFESFDNLTNTCNTCHQMEDVAFITVVTPKIRHTVVEY